MTKLLALYLNLFIQIYTEIVNKLITIDIDADMSIEIFAIFTIVRLWINANSDTNIDIVNPIPAIKDTKKIDFQLIFLGFSIILNRLPK